MFCSNCGTEITSGQLFCSQCGTKIMSGSLERVNTQRADSEFNRDMLINYLNNVQTLEFANHKLNEDKLTLEHKIASLGYRYNIDKPTFESKWFIIGELVISFIFWMTLQTGLYLIAILSALAFVAVIVWCTVDYVGRMKEYTKNVTYRDTVLQNEYQEKAYLSEVVLPRINEDIKHNETLLEKAYSINITPKKCRNIYGAKFLYEYISTSMVTLSEALFHFDLDEIKSELDVVIQQQRDMILELAHSNALNRKMLEQNENMLNKVANIETNTALAAQYAQVCAVNTETCAWIQRYNYYKDSYS